MKGQDPDFDHCAVAVQEKSREMKTEVYEQRTFYLQLTFEWFEMIAQVRQNENHW